VRSEQSSFTERRSDKKAAWGFRQATRTTLIFIAAALLIGQGIYTWKLWYSPQIKKYSDFIPLKDFDPELYKNVAALQAKIYKDNPDLPPLEGIYVTPYLLGIDYRTRTEVFRYYGIRTFAYIANGKWKYAVAFTQKVAEEFPEEYVKVIFAHEIGHLKYHFPPHPVFIIQTWRTLTLEKQMRIELEADCFAAEYLGKKAIADALSLLTERVLKVDPEVASRHERVRAIKALCQSRKK